MATLGSLVAQIDLDSTSFLRNTANVKTALTALEGSAAQAGAGIQSGLAGSSGTLVQVYEQARRASGGVVQASDDLEASSKKVAKGVRTIAVPVVNELSPAMGELGNQIARTVITGVNLGNGLGALAVIAAGVAGIFGERLFASFQRAREEKEKLNRALATGDMTALGQIADETAQKIENIKAFQLNEQLAATPQ